MIRALVLLCLLLLPAPAQAALEDNLFARLPVLEEGRLKPLDSFATHLRVQLSGSATGGGLSAPAWLAQALFDPARAADEPSFKVSNAHVRSIFALETRKGQLYSLAEIAPGLASSAAAAAALLEKPAKNLTRDEQELLTLHTNALLYNQLLQSFSLILPLPFAAPAELQLGPAPSYLEAQRLEPELAERLQKILTPEVIENPEQLTPAQQQLALFMQGLQQLREGGTNNQLLRVIASGWDDGLWFSPWQLLLQGQGSPQARIQLQGWQDLASAYRAQDAARWQQASHSLWQSLSPELRTRLDLEVRYRHLHLYDIALTLLALAALVALRWFKPALALGTLAAALIALALAFRVFILQRPPVGTLHESVLFVALITQIGALWLALRRHLPLLLLAGQLTTLLLLVVAPFIQTSSENLSMLSAVLNTNFWLMVHVLCITAGYGACALTSALAVSMLAHQGLRRSCAALLQRASLVALLLTAVGTLLGGVWADQSWGRFWGWDPKENGALIIVLWLIWLQHARLAGQVTSLTFTAGMAALAVIVAQAWFGVNLLSTGLHSYGFIEGIALGLFSFTALHLALVAGLWWRAARQDREERQVHA